MRGIASPTTFSVDHDLLPESVAVPVSAARCDLHKSVIIQFLLCTIALPPTFWLGIPKLGGFTFVAGVAGFLIYDFYRGKRFEALALVIGTVPLMDLLRGTFMPFNTPLVIMTFLFVWMCYTPDLIRTYWTRKIMRYVIAAAIIYWLISFALTDDYARSIRVVEWALTASIVFMLGERRSYLATAFVGVGISAIFIGVTLLPYGDRLGMSGKVEGLPWGIGNPIVLGVPLSFFLLLCVAERGRWLLLEKRLFWRVFFISVVGILLLLSTSRGSWLILITGMIVISIFDRHARMQMIYAMGILAIIVIVLPMVNVSRIANVQHYLIQTFSPDTTIEKRTTGRIDQWRILPELLSDSPVWGVGPGGGRAASRAYANKNIIFHSLYLQIAGETGILGIPFLLLLLASTLRTAWYHYKTFGEIVPVLGIIAFMVMGLSVSGLEILGGMLLGVGFLGGNGSNLWILREGPREIA